MRMCSEILDIEEFVHGHVEEGRAAYLRVHVLRCDVCHAEMISVLQERALFAHRAAMMGPPPAKTGSMESNFLPKGRSREERGNRFWPARRGVERFVRTGRTVVGEVIRRGQIAASCAVAILAVVALSKLNSKNVYSWNTADKDDIAIESSTASRLFSASSEEEPLACLTGSDDRNAVSHASLPSAREVLMCGSVRDSLATCEPFVTSSPLRQ